MTPTNLCAAAVALVGFAAVLGLSFAITGPRPAPVSANQPVLDALQVVAPTTMGGECPNMAASMPIRSVALTRTMLERVRRDPAGTVTLGDGTDVALRDVPTRAADALDACLEGVERPGPGWVRLSKRLRAAR